MATAEMIRDAREQLAETQAVFCKRFGVDQGTISRWEKEGPPDRGPAAVLIEQFFATGAANNDRAEVSEPAQKVGA